LQTAKFIICCKSTHLYYTEFYEILPEKTHNLEVPGSSPGWSTKHKTKEIKPLQRDL